MNLSKLFEMQKELDERILDRFPELRNEDLLDKKILALQVELGELAQNWRGFKFWSEDKKERGHGKYLEYRRKCEGGNRWVEKNPLLEEYVDCLHFILSIGLELGMDEIADELDLKKFDFLTFNTILSCFMGLSYDIADLYYQRENDDIVPYLYEYILLEFAKLGKMLGFTWEQVEQAYLEKNKINHERQEAGY